MLSVQDFAAKIKAKYPEYQNVDDNTLAQKIVAKYPEYQNQVDLSGGASQPQGQPVQDQGQSNQPAPTPDQSQGSDQSTQPTTDTSGQNQSQQPTDQGDGTMKDLYNAKIANGENPNSNNIVDSVKQGADFLTQGIVKPLAKFGVGAVVTGAKDLQAIAQGSYTGASAAIQGKQINPQDVTDINQQGTAPVDIPWLGNVNFNQANDKGNVDTGRSMLTQGAAAAEAALAGLNVIDPTANVAENAIRSGLQGAFHEAQDKNASITSTAAAGAESAASAAILGPIFNKVLGNSTWSGEAKDFIKNIEEAGTKAGLQPVVIKSLKTMSAPEATLQGKFIQMAKDNVDDPDNINKPSPMIALGDRVTEGMRKLYGIMQDKGASIGETKGNIITGQQEAPAINVQGARKDLLGSLATKGVTVGNDGLLDFSKSTLANQKGDQTAISNLWDSIRQTKEISAPEALILREKLQNDLYAGQRRGDVSAAGSFLTKFEQNLTGQIHENHPELAELDNTFSTIKKAVTGFTKKTQGAVPLTTEEAISGANTPNLLRRSLGNANRDNSNAVQALEDLGTKFQIPELMDLKKTTRMAQIAEDLVGTDIKTKPTSMNAMLKKGKQSLGFVGAVADRKFVEAGQRMHELVKADPDQLTTFEKLLKGPATQSTFNKIASHPVMQLLKQHIQTSIPQSVSQAAQPINQDMPDLLP